MNSIRKVIMTSIATVGAMYGASAFAAEITPPTVVVSLEGVDVASDHGAKLLYARLRSASRSVCANYEGDSLHSQKLWNNCFDQALNAAVSRLELEKLTALHQRSKGQMAVASAGSSAEIASAP